MNYTGDNNAKASSDRTEVTRDHLARWKITLDYTADCNLYIPQAG